MLRRALTVAFAAASLALVPATASATPEQAPVENYMFTQYSGTATVLLGDGRTVEISLMENRSTGAEGSAHLSVTTYREVPCWWGPGTCRSDLDSDFVPLSDEQFDIERSLGRASVTDVPVTIAGYVNGTQAESVTISVRLTGTGPVSRSASHGTTCGDGSRECQSIRVEASRAAVSEVTFGDETVTGEGSLFRGRSVDAAAPKFVYDGS